MGLERQLPRYFTILLSFDFLSSVFSFAAPLLAPLLILAGVSPVNAGWIQCVAYLCTGVFQPLIGHLLDSGRFRLVLIASGVAISAGILLMMFQSHSLFWLVFGIIQLLLGLNTLSTLFMRTAVGEVSDELRPFAMGRMYLVHNLGFSFAAVLAYFFLKEYRNVLLVADLVTTLGVLCALWFIMGYIMKTLRAKLQGTKTGSIPWPLILKNWRVMVGITLIWIAIFIHTAVLPLIYAKDGFDPIQLTTLVLITNTLIVVLTASKVSEWVTRYSERSMYAFAAALYCLFQGMTPFFVSRQGVVATAALWTLGEVFSAVLISQVMYRTFPRENSGLASGVMVTLRSLGLFLAPFLAVMVVPKTHLVQAVVIGLVPLLSFIVIYPKLKSTP
jgi:MFS family permease